MGEKSSNHGSSMKYVDLEKDDLWVVANSSWVLLACVRDIKSIGSLYRLCLKEGFFDIDITYVGGNWVWVGFSSSIVCGKFKQSERFKEVFKEFKKVENNFVENEILAWVDIEQGGCEKSTKPCVGV
ncbi:hypothetical protein L1987_13648 [Smallanthus sonchifolius]|uniref:Uncharacterized protein n=1 Tax=Smallanthus sonchifolius TaxID=185202 RepID=A0ACB9JJC7_9ASTR|nr:hypothetical protein L1987_13648 [Smallanthus sonchifolius]